MSTDKHTPGPWEVQQSTVYALEDDVPSSRFRSRKRNRFFASVQGYPSTSISELIANARLMATAPELLAACQVIVKACEAGHAAVTKDVISAIRAVIARATEGGTGDDHPC